MSPFYGPLPRRSANGDHFAESAQRASAAYVEVSGQGGASQLWRYPADGSAPTKLGTAPTVDANALSYSADPQPRTD